MKKLEIEKKCKHFEIINNSCIVTINEEGAMNEDGDVRISRRFKKLLFKFNKVSGNFDCSHCPLTSLSGYPIEVGGSFLSNDCNLNSLDACPEYIGLKFCCAHNGTVDFLDFKKIEILRIFKKAQKEYKN